MENPEKFKVDRTQFSVGSLADQGDDVHYWKTKTHHERLQGLETTRQMIYGYDSATARLQRVFEVVKHPQG
jgi:hypothetical protein